jgi:membrane-associated protease RseP (regulator of RpoE activity)
MGHLNLVPGVDQEIESQFIRCPRYKFGCHRILRVGDLILHEKVCANSPSPQSARKSAKKVNIKINCRPGEALGFHVAGGDKLSVSNVVKGLPADRAGLRAGDRILEVNSQCVKHWTHQDAVNLIRRSTPPVVISVERYMDRGNHVYEEIDSAHQHTPQHAHQPSRTSDRDSGMGRSEFSASSQLLSRGTPVEGSSPTKGDSPSHKTQPKLEPLKKSTDRPLASSFERNQESRMSVRTESEMVRSSRKARVRKPSLDTIMQEKPEDQIMDVTLHRSVGTRLGITLGFDQNKKTSKLYVMHLLPDGIAAKDGRLMEGDVIVKINGFEVHDTEEALMMFLEQDPSITITVARSRKAVQASLMRRVDSCGSLDSHTHQNTIPENRQVTSPPECSHTPQSGTKLAPPSSLMRVLSPQEVRSPLRHFTPRGSQGNGIIRGSPRRVGIKKDHFPHDPHHTPSHVMHLRATSAPETQV